MIDEDLDDENFDKPKKKIDSANSTEDFNDDEDDHSRDESAEEDVEVVIDDSEPAVNRQETKSQEKRLGKRRGRFKTRGRDQQYVRNLEATVNSLQRNFETIKGELDEVKQSGHRTSEANIDSQINEAQRYHDSAKAAHAQAVKDGDGTAAAEALDVMFEAREALNTLRYSKQEVGKQSVQSDSVREKANGDVTISRPKVDPKVMQKFDNWSTDNEWFDPRLGDQYSRIAFHIDNAIKAEGFDPRTDEYWDELNERLRGNKVLSSAGIFEEEYDDSSDERERKMDDRQRRVVKNDNTGQRRAAPQTERSPHNSSGGKPKIVVSKARADAMREMGLQPGTKEWNTMAKKYSSWDKSNARA